MLPEYFIEPDELETLRHLDNVIIIDLCSAENYVKAHIPGAQWLEYAKIKKIDKPAMGLLPDDDKFSSVVSSLGITPETLVIAYDDVNCGCAARLIWTLYVFGHDNAVILNGGFHSWKNEGHPLNSLVPAKPVYSDYQLFNTRSHLATLSFIQSHLNDDNVLFLDTRSYPEYTGERVRAEKIGHIPGAIHYEWTQSIAHQNNSRRLPDEVIQGHLDDLGVGKDKQVVCYCQSHHRSSFSWLILKQLGYKNVLGYPGSWSEWGNHPQTPVEHDL